MSQALPELSGSSGFYNHAEEKSTVGSYILNYRFPLGYSLPNSELRSASWRMKLHSTRH